MPFGGPAARTGSRTLAYVPGLDGLRGIAVLAVLLHHADGRLLRGGFLGVSTFFTLSGFLITTILLVERHRTGSIDAMGFWGRRVRRLLPAALVTILAVVTVEALTGGDDLHALRLDALAALGNVANWRFLASDQSYADLFGDPSPLLHFWSLAIEEQFYVVYPLLVIAVLGVTRSRRALAGALVVLTVLSGVVSAVLYAPGAVDAAYYSTASRAAELLVGALLALWVARAAQRTDTRKNGARVHALDVAGVGGLAGLAVLYASTDVGDAWLYHGGLVGVALVGAVVIRAVLERGSLTARALSFEPLRLLGVISYGVYVAHWPVFVWLDTSSTGLDGGALFALRLAVTLALATASYHLIERPVRAGRLPGSVRRVRWWGAPAAIGAVAVVILAATVGAPAPSPQFTVTSEDARAAIEAQARALDQEADAGTAPPRVMVIGDSVAESLGEGLVSWAEESGQLDVANAGAPGCGMVTGGEVRVWGGTEDEDCLAWLEDTWQDGVESFRPDAVLVLSGPHDILDRRLPEWGSFDGLGDPRFDDWLVATYAARARDFAAMGAEVVWLTPPCAQEIAGPLFETGAFDSGNLEYLGDRILPRVMQEPGVDITVVDLFAHVCPGGEPPLDVAGVTDDTPDGVHFSEQAAVSVSEWLGPQLVALTT